MSEATALVQLQEIDLRLLRLKVELDSMPQQKKLQTIKAALKKVSSELTKIVGQRKDAQTDIEAHGRGTFGKLSPDQRPRGTAQPPGQACREVRVRACAGTAAP